MMVKDLYVTLNPAASAQELVLAMPEFCNYMGVRLTSSPKMENDNGAHISISFALNEKRVLFCTSKVTPGRPGHFVCCYKKSHGLNQPYHVSDTFDAFLISCAYEDPAGTLLHRGQFLFEKKLLVEKKILSSESSLGKMAMRVFPPWSEGMSEAAKSVAIGGVINLNPRKEFSAHAKKSQQWQLARFIDFSDCDSGDVRDAFQAVLSYI